MLYVFAFMLVCFALDIMNPVYILSIMGRWPNVQINFVTCHLPIWLSETKMSECQGKII